MKKIASLVTMGLLIGGLTFADDAVKPGITFGAWGRVIAAPFMSAEDSAGDTGVTAGFGTSWGSTPRVGFSMAGNSEFVGFIGTAAFDNAGKLYVTDNEEVWVKPFPGVKIQVGCAYNDTLSGVVDYGSWDWIRFDGVGDRAVFSRVGEQTPVNAIFSYTMGGLFAFYEIATPRDSSNNTTVLDKWSDKRGVLNDSSVGAGYTIENVGQIRAQYVGYTETGTINNSVTVGSVVDYTSYGMFEAAFRLTGVKDLYADIGVWAPVNGYDGGTASDFAGYKAKVPVYATYTIDKATIHGLFVYQKATTGDDPMMGAVGVDYTINSDFSLTSDLRLYDKAWDLQGSDQSNVGVLVGINKNFSNGSLGVGFEYTTTAFSAAYATEDVTKAHWAVPVNLTYWF